MRRTGAEIRNAIAAEEEGGLVRQIAVRSGGARLVVSETAAKDEDPASGRERRTERFTLPFRMAEFDTPASVSVELNIVGDDIDLGGILYSGGAALSSSAGRGSAVVDSPRHRPNSP